MKRILLSEIDIRNKFAILTDSKVFIPLICKASKGSSDEFFVLNIYKKLISFKIQKVIIQ